MLFEFVDMLPPFKIKYPKDFTSFATREMPKVFIYDRFKRKAFCSNCEKHITYIAGNKTPKEPTRIMYNMPAFRAGDLVTCPVCGKRLVARPHTSDIACRRDLAFFWAEDQGNAVKFALVFCRWAYNGAALENFKPCIEVYPSEVCVLTREVQEAYECYGKNHWNELTSVYVPHNLDLGYALLHPGFQKVKQKSFLKYATSFMSYSVKAILQELALNAKYPQLEYIAKAGLGDIVHNLVHGSSTYIRPNWRAKTLAGFLGITSQDIDKLKQWGAWNLDDIARYKLIKKFYTRPTKKMLELLKSSGITLSDYYKEFSEHDPVKLARCIASLLKEEPACSHGYSMYYPGSAIREYRDYLQQATAAGYDLKDEYYLYPKNFAEAHARVQSEYRRLLNEQEAQRRQQEAAKLKTAVEALESLCYEDETYLIRPLRTIEEFMEEGQANHNCVASYISRAANSETKIFVIRKKTEPEKSFVTLELSVDEKRIVQCYGRGNSIPEKDVLEFADSWLEKIVTKTTRKKGAA